MPPSLRMRVDHFQRPQDFITDKLPVIFDPDNGTDFDLLSANSHINDCEVSYCGETLKSISLLGRVDGHPFQKRTLR